MIKSGLTGHESPLAALIVKSGMSMNALAKLVGVPRQYIGRWAKGEVRLDSSHADRISAVTGWPRAEIIFGGQQPESDTSEPLPISHVHVRGNVQAGIWTEFEEVSDDVDFIPSIPGKHNHLEQVAYRVAGTSMNAARLFDGDYVICVPYFLARAKPTHDDLAVVERRRGGTVERTVKQIEITPDGECLLWPRSDDPRFQNPIRCNGPEPDGTEIEITGLVIGSFTPR